MAERFKTLSLTGGAVVDELAACPWTAVAGFGCYWVKNDGTPQFRDDAGTDHNLLTASSIINTATVTTTGGDWTTCGTIPLADNTVYHVKARAVARRTDGPDQYIAERAGGFYREAGGGATQHGVTVTILEVGQANFHMSLDTDGNDVRVRVDGHVGQTVKWKTEWYTVVTVS